MKKKESNDSDSKQTLNKLGRISHPAFAALSFPGLQALVPAVGMPEKIKRKKEMQNMHLILHLLSKSEQGNVLQQSS